KAMHFDRKFPGIAAEQPGVLVGLQQQIESADQLGGDVGILVSQRRGEVGRVHWACPLRGKRWRQAVVAFRREGSNNSRSESKANKQLFDLWDSEWISAFCVNCKGNSHFTKC